MEAAVDDVRAECMGYRAASTLYNVPKSTLERRVKNKNKNAVGSNKVLGAKMTVFSDEMESKVAFGWRSCSLV